MLFDKAAYVGFSNQDAAPRSSAACATIQMANVESPSQESTVHC
jgi:hypothetical protein